MSIWTALLSAVGVVGALGFAGLSAFLVIAPFAGYPLWFGGLGVLGFVIFAALYIWIAAYITGSK